MTDEERYIAERLIRYLAEEDVPVEIDVDGSAQRLWIDDYVEPKLRVGSSAPTVKASLMPLIRGGGMIDYEITVTVRRVRT